MSLKSIYAQILNKQSQKDRQLSDAFVRQRSNQKKLQILENKESNFSLERINFQSESLKLNQINENYQQNCSQSKQQQKGKISSNKKLEQYQKTTIQNLLNLQRKWIQKQTEIQKYIQSLLETIKQQKLKIEKIETEKNNIENELSQSERQKNNVMDKLNQIHQNLKLLQTQKKLIKKRQFSFGKQFQQRYNHFPTKNQKNNVGEILSSEDYQRRIITSIMKIFQENFMKQQSDSESEISEQVTQQNQYQENKRHIRVTSSTDDNFLQKSFQKMKKCDSQDISEYGQYQNRKDVKRPTYKSAKTITFNRQSSEVQGEQIVEKDLTCISPNQIKQTQISSSTQETKLKQRKNSLRSQGNKKKMSLKSHIVSQQQNGNLNCSQRNQSQNFSLTSSLVSASQVDYSQMSYNNISKISQKNIEEESQHVFDLKEDRKVQKTLKVFSTFNTIIQKNKQDGLKKEIKPVKNMYTIQKQSSIFVPNTQIKKQCFATNTKDMKKTDKKDAFSSYQTSGEPYTLLVPQKLVMNNPQTKCNSFVQTSSMNNGIFEKTVSSSSQQPFKNLMLIRADSGSQTYSSNLSLNSTPCQSQNAFYSPQSKQQKIDLQKIKFQNSVLKSYNHTLDIKATNKNQSKSSKMVQKFKNQNTLFLGKYGNKKSTY